MNTGTPANQNATPAASIPTTTGNVIPFQGSASLDSLTNVNNSYSTPLHGTAHELRAYRRQLVDKLTVYARPMENRDARRMLAKIKGCGILPIGKGISLTRSTINGKTVAGCVLGVRSCKDRSCPVCAARTESTEALETRAALLHLHQSGTLGSYRLTFFTATMGHRATDDHARNWKAFHAVLSKMLNQRWWRSAVAGSIVKLEIEGTLHGRNGLHPHAHALLAIPRTVDADKLAARVQRFFRDEFAKHYPGESRIGWKAPKEETWWQDAHGASNLPYYFSKKRWSIAEEVTASGAKNGGFWQRPIEDLVAVWSLMEGVRATRRSGIFKTALAAVRSAAVKPETVTIARMNNTQWSALRPEIREPLTAATENINAAPDWIAWVVGNLHQLTPAEAEMILLYLATTTDSSEFPAVPSLGGAQVVMSGEARIA